MGSVEKGSFNIDSYCSVMMMQSDSETENNPEIWVTSTKFTRVWRLRADKDELNNWIAEMKQFANYVPKVDDEVNLARQFRYWRNSFRSGSVVLPPGLLGKVTKVERCIHTADSDFIANPKKCGKCGGASWFGTIEHGFKEWRNPDWIGRSMHNVIEKARRRRRLGDTASELLAMHRLTHPYRDSPVLLRLLEKIRRAQRA